jgi:hypothetical protein
VTDVDTGKDKSKELLESEWAKEIHRRISIELDSGENFPEAH